VTAFARPDIVSIADESAPAQSNLKHFNPPLYPLLAQRALGNESGRHV
jgi:hypothetical protein